MLTIQCYSIKVYHGPWCMRSWDLALECTGYTARQASFKEWHACLADRSWQIGLSKNLHAIFLLVVLLAGGCFLSCLINAPHHCFGAEHGAAVCDKLHSSRCIAKQKDWRLHERNFLSTFLQATCPGKMTISCTSCFFLLQETPCFKV